MCPCTELAKKSFRCVEDSVHSIEADGLKQHCEIVSRADHDTLTLLRCRTCHQHWVEGCSSSGPMDIYHCFPVPPETDAAAWFPLAKPLPFRVWL